MAARPSATAAEQPPQPDERQDRGHEAVALPEVGPDGLVGVVTVGAWSLLDPGAFPDQTVWSDLGRGYGYVPAVLPFVGLWWLLGRRR